MKKKVVHILIIWFLFAGSIEGVQGGTVFAAEKGETLSAEIYEFDEESHYDLDNLSAGIKVNQKPNRVNIEGNIVDTTIDQGIIAYAVDAGNLSVVLNKEENERTYSETVEDETMWHIVSDKSKEVNGTVLDDKIGTGVLIVQTSKDNKIWIDALIETDIFNGVMKNQGSVYNTKDVQLVNGCYYRIIIAYQMERKVESSKIIVFEKKNYERKKCAEIYTFYAYDKNVDLKEKLDTTNAYKFYNVVRTEDAEGYSGKKEITLDDPHYGWKIGEFWVSGYTDKVETEDGRIVFLKEAGDQASLWFQLEQDIGKCHGNVDIKVGEDTIGSDRYFQVPAMNFGHGALIIKKVDYQNNEEKEIYTNYLEASAIVGANTRVNLFEEGDYEVALDYMLEYGKTKVFGKTVLPKTLHYRVAFRFSVRNGDCKLFARDAKTNQFIDNEDVTENGFYIDLAESKYLSLVVKREIMKDSFDGLVTDTKFNGVATEGRVYTDEGIYTIKATNNYTDVTTEKKIYVGNEDVLRAYIKTGLSIDVINEKIAAGAHIDAEGNLVEAEIWKAHILTELPIDEINAKVAAGAYIDEEGNIVEPEENIALEKSMEDISMASSDNIVEEKVGEEKKTIKKPVEAEKLVETSREETGTENVHNDLAVKKINPIVVVFTIILFSIAGMTVYLKKKKWMGQKGDERE